MPQATSRLIHAFARVLKPLPIGNLPHRMRCWAAIANDGWPRKDFATGDLSRHIFSSSPVEGIFRHAHPVTKVPHTQSRLLLLRNPLFPLFRRMPLCHHSPPGKPGRIPAPATCASPGAYQRSGKAASQQPPLRHHVLPRLGCCMRSYAALSVSAQKLSIPTTSRNPIPAPAMSSTIPPQPTVVRL